MTSVLRNFRLNGRKFRYTGKLPFTAAAHKNPFYTTYFGPVFFAGFEVYDNNVCNVENALIRITGARDGEDILRKNNEVIRPGKGRRLARYINSAFTKIRSRITPELMNLYDDVTEQIILACKPHPKEKLRKRAINKLLASADMLNSIFMKNIGGKVKIPEFAKPGKKPRLIGDYTCEGSLLAAFLVPLAKYAFAEDLEFDGATFKFALGTSVSDMDSYFQQFHDSNRDIYIFFSDDVICKVRGSYTWERANLDISNCDMSNGDPVFSRLAWLFEGTNQHHQLILRACEQCKQNLVIRNPENPSEWITANLTRHVEFSGTQLTTILNNIASLSICLSIHYKKIRGSLQDHVRTRACAVGYEMTCDLAANPENVQFLKHSYSVDREGKCRSWVNVGCYLRALGSHFMDLPYNSKTETLADAGRFKNWAVLKGFANAGSNPILESLVAMPGAKRPEKGKYKIVQKSIEKSQHYKSYVGSGTRPPMSPLALGYRYGITGDELEDFTRKTLTMDIGKVICHIVIDKVMFVDYGLTRPKEFFFGS